MSEPVKLELLGSLLHKPIRIAVGLFLVAGAGGAVVALNSSDDAEGPGGTGERQGVFSPNKPGGGSQPGDAQQGAVRVPGSDAGSARAMDNTNAAAFNRKAGIPGAEAVPVETQASDAFSGGTFEIVLGASNSPDNRLTVGASNLVPGDSIQRAVNVANSGTEAFAAVALTTSATVSSPLDYDTVNGLQMSVDQCSQPWRETGPPYQYTCAGQTTTVVAERAVIGGPFDLGSGATAAGSKGHYRVSLRVPSNAGSQIQGAASTVQYSFAGIQRAR